MIAFFLVLVSLMIILPDLNFNLIDELNSICAKFIIAFRHHFITWYELEISADIHRDPARQFCSSEEW